MKFLRFPRKQDMVGVRQERATSSHRELCSRVLNRRRPSDFTSVSSLDSSNTMFSDLWVADCRLTLSVFNFRVFCITLGRQRVRADQNTYTYFDEPGQEAAGFSFLRPGIDDLLLAIVEKLPAPASTSGADAPVQAIIFDSWFDPKNGIVLLVAVKVGLAAVTEVTLAGNSSSACIESRGFPDITGTCSAVQRASSLSQCFVYGWPKLERLMFPRG